MFNSFEVQISVCLKYIRWNSIQKAIKALSLSRKSAKLLTSRITHKEKQRYLFKIYAIENARPFLSRARLISTLFAFVSVHCAWQLKLQTKSPITLAAAAASTHIAPSVRRDSNCFWRFRVGWKIRPSPPLSHIWNYATHHTRSLLMAAEGKFAPKANRRRLGKRTSELLAVHVAGDKLPAASPAALPHSHLACRNF